MPQAPKRRRIAKFGLYAAVGWISLVILVAVFADLLPLHSPDQFTDFEPRRSVGWRLREPLGTDSYGRSVASRLSYGARQSLMISFLSVGIAVVVGSAIGLATGYLRGKVDAVAGVVLDTWLAFPPLILLLAIASVGARNQTTLIIGLSVLLIAPFARLVRGNTLAFADREFVLAARAMGASNRRIMFRELLPNVIPSLVSVVFLYVALVIVYEGTLSFLGLGIPPPESSWGGMISEARRYLVVSPGQVLVPALVLLFTVMALRRIGEQFRIGLGAGSAL